MKKVVRLICIVLCMLFVVSSATACGGKGRDKNTLLIKMYQGGYGSRVTEELEKAWNAKYEKGEESFRIKIMPGVYGLQRAHATGCMR